MDFQIETVSKKQRDITTAPQRITAAFMKLLERQFPIAKYPLQLRSASQFAVLLNIHVNHLNYSLKKTLMKTTTEVIAARVLQEAKRLLVKSDLSIPEIAFLLGFTETTHFNNFFRKHEKTSPTKFREG